MPAKGDLPACPFLTISEPHEGALSAGDEEGSEEYCTEPEDAGNTGWIELYDEDNPGCGLFYDCCARVIPVACMEKLCMLFNATSRTCGIGGGGGGGGDVPIEFKWVQEWLSWRDVDGDNEVYGKDWVLADPPPCLWGIPPEGWAVPPAKTK